MATAMAKSLLLPLSALCLLALVGCRASALPEKSPGSESEVLVPETLPAHLQEVFSVPSRTLVLTFFDLYCVPCQQSAPNFRALAQKVKDRGVREMTIRGIAHGNTELELEAYQERYQLPFASVADPEESLEEILEIRGTPTVLVLRSTPEGWKEMVRHEGRLRDADLENLLAQLP